MLRHVNTYTVLGPKLWNILTQLFYNHTRPLLYREITYCIFITGDCKSGRWRIMVKVLKVGIFWACRADFSVLLMSYPSRTWCVQNAPYRDLASIGGSSTEWKHFYWQTLWNSCICILKKASYSRALEIPRLQRSPLLNYSM